MSDAFSNKANGVNEFVKGVWPHIAKVQLGRPHRPEDGRGHDDGRAIVSIRLGVEGYRAIPGRDISSSKSSLRLLHRLLAEPASRCAVAGRRGSRPWRLRLARSGPRTGGRLIRRGQISGERLSSVSAWSGVQDAASGILVRKGRFDADDAP